MHEIILRLSTLCPFPHIRANPYMRYIDLLDFIFLIVNFFQVSPSKTQGDRGLHLRFLAVIDHTGR